MDMETTYFDNEFIGEISKYCIEGDYIWFYDEISGGLYRLDKKNYVVEVLLTPMEIHEKGIFPMLQIAKWRNEIYLIPNNLSHEWLIYNVATKQLRSVLLCSQSYKVGNVIGIREKIYLIPEKTDQIVAIMNAETLDIEIITDNWYKNVAGQQKCWGYSVLEDVVSFPIIGSREIFQIKGKQIKNISLNIEYPVASISLSKNGVWVLPIKGNHVFFTDRNGMLIESVEIRTRQRSETADIFGRIVTIGTYVCLLPKRGGQMWILRENDKEWIVIGERDKSLYRPLYQKTRSIPYWGCYYNEGKLYTLPLQYRLAEIDIENKSINYIVLQCETTLMKQKYMTWIHWLNNQEGNLYMEWRRTLLKEFLDLMPHCCGTHSNRSVGNNIWTRMKEIP